MHKRIDLMIKKIKDEPLYRNSLFISSSNLFNALVGFLFCLIATNLYSLEDVGMATALISSQGLIILFSRLGFDVSIIRFFPLNEKSKIINTSLAITSFFAVIVGIIYICFIDSLAPNLQFLKSPIYASSFLIFSVMASLAGMTGNAFVASRRSDHLFLQNLLLAIRIPLLFPLRVLGSYGIFCSTGLAYLLSSILAMLFLRKAFNVSGLNVDVDYAKKSFKFSSINYFSSILFSIPTILLPIIILNLMGELEAGKYFVAFTIANIILIIPTAISTSLFVEGSYNSNLKKNLFRACLINFLILIPTILFIFIFGESIIRLFNINLLDSLILIKLLALSSIFVSIYSLFIPIQNIRLKIGNILIFNLIRCILLIILDYYFIIKYGIIGAGYGWFITYILLFILILLVPIDGRKKMIISNFKEYRISN